MSIRTTPSTCWATGGATRGRTANAGRHLPTDYGYTGQREESALGLMYYVARWYDSGIGHFVQADTVVPGAGNPAAWNRYAYVMYNPVSYVDPSGHWAVGDGGTNLNKLVDPVIPGPIGDDIGLNAALQEELENTEEEKTAVSESNNNGSSCPQEYPECQIIYAGQATEEYLIELLGRLDGSEIGLLLMATGFEVLGIPEANIPLILLGAELAYEMLAISEFKDYVRDLVTIARENNGIAEIVIFNDTEDGFLTQIWSPSMPYTYKSSSGVVFLYINQVIPKELSTK